MKKTLSILLALALVLSMGAMSAFAVSTDAKVDLAANVASAKVGDVVTVTVKVTPDSNSGISALGFSVLYNVADFELVADSVVTNKVFDLVSVNSTAGAVKYQATSEQSLTSTKDVLSFKLKVLKTDGTVNLDFSGPSDVIALGDFNGTDITAETVANSVTTVTVACNHTYGNWTVTTPATCTTPGEETRTCTACGAEDHRAVSATGHHYGDWVVTTPATCTTPGVETRTCNDCGATETRPTALAAHTPGEWEVETPATCTEAGVEVQKCTECGTELDSRAISALGHHVEDWVVDAAPDCENEGHRHGECTVCHATVDEDMDALGHDVADDAWTVETPATCTEPGLKKAVCATCGDEVEEVIAPLGHSFGEWKVVKEPTATEEGSKERVCSVCGEKEVVAIDKLTVTTDTSVPNIPKTSGTVAGGIAALAMLSMAAGVAAVTMKKKHEDD
ncbi:MAG: cohesin domain-containing protein [Ruminococcus sp.]|nr:cohesin domain-containing protein [Ruminococcus sp.]